jgi:hypothetical protein
MRMELSLTLEEGFKLECKHKVTKRHSQVVTISDCLGSNL